MHPLEREFSVIRSFCDSGLGVSLANSTKGMHGEVLLTNGCGHWLKVC